MMMALFMRVNIMNLYKKWFELNQTIF